MTAPPSVPDGGAGCDPERAAEVLGALANPWHIEIVRLLATSELDVTQLTTRLGPSVANNSHHLGRLRRAGLVLSRRVRTRITNRLAGPHVLDLCRAAYETVGPPFGRRRTVT